MIEVFIILGLIVGLIIWLIGRDKRTPEERDTDRERQYERDLAQVKLQAKEEQRQIELEAKEELHEKELEHRESIKAVRKDSVSRSRFSLTGKIYEQICSIFKGFPYNPADLRFIGAPIDYLVFHNMSKKSIDKVIFLEIKTGNSKLTEQQENLKRAIKAKRVEWKEYRIK